MSKSKVFLKNINISMNEIYDENETIVGVNFKFYPINENSIYMTSSDSVVHNFPKELSEDGINMDQKSLVDFAISLNAAISTAMFATRKLMPNGGELDFVSKSSLDERFFLKINTTKHFFRDGNLGVNKVKLSIFEDDEDFGKNELIELTFTKKDVQILFKLINEYVNNIEKSPVYFIPAERISKEDDEFIDNVDIPFIKIGNSIMFDGVWLHGQELFNIMFVTDQLIYELNIEDNLKVLNSKFRQIEIISDENVTYLIIKKIYEDGENVNKTMDGQEFYLKIPISLQLLTLFSLYVSINMLEHKNEFNEFNYENIDSFNNTKGLDFHLSTKESFIGLGYVNHKKHGEMLRFFAKTKEDAFKVEDENGVYDLMYEKDGEKFAVVESLELNMFDQWKKLIDALSIAYTQSYKEFEKESYMKKFFVSKNENGKWFRYEFIVSSSVGNKAAAVIVVNKYLMKGKELELISSFRQPLFKKYLYQLLLILISLSKKFTNSEFLLTVNKKDMIKYRYKSMKDVSKLNKNEEVLYGFKKDLLNVEWGIFSDNNNMKGIIEDEDLVLLRISSLFRLLRGNWLPFIGYKICVGPDKYLTDVHGEMMLENKMGEGETWASHVLYITN